jgi:hypothetical protein
VIHGTDAAGPHHGGPLLRSARISLADDLSVGFCADAVAVADPETIVRGVESDLAALGV